MGRYTETENRVKRVVIEPLITRAYWSRERVYQGDTVKLFIETARMPDGAELKVLIRELDGDTLVDEPKGPFKVKGNRCSAEYVVDWDADTLGKPLELLSGRFEFYFLVTHEAFGVSRRSNALYVDLHDFALSS
jgi:hypothetical protein